MWPTLTLPVQAVCSETIRRALQLQRRGPRPLPKVETLVQRLLMALSLGPTRLRRSIRGWAVTLLPASRQHGQHVLAERPWLPSVTASWLLRQRLLPSMLPMWRQEQGLILQSPRQRPGPSSAPSMPRQTTMAVPLQLWPPPGAHQLRRDALPPLLHCWHSRSAMQTSSVLHQPPLASLTGCVVTSPLTIQR